MICTCPGCGATFEQKTGSPLTATQKRLRDFIVRFSNENGFCPSFVEMQKAMGLCSKSAVHRTIKCLEQRGVIGRIPNAARSIVVLS